MEKSLFIYSYIFCALCVKSCSGAVSNVLQCCTGCRLQPVHHTLFQLSALLPPIKRRFGKVKRLSLRRYCLSGHWRVHLRLGRENARGAHPVERRGFSHALAAQGGQREALVALRRPVAAVAALQRGLKLLLKVAVEEAVHHRVDAGGRHGCQVTRGEDGVVLAVGQHLVVPVEQRVEDVERQPAQGEGDDDGQQHDVDPVGSSRPPAALQHVPATAQVEEFHPLLQSTDNCVLKNNIGDIYKVLV